MCYDGLMFGWQQVLSADASARHRYSYSCQGAPTLCFNLFVTVTYLHLCYYVMCSVMVSSHLNKDMVSHIWLRGIENVDCKQFFSPVITRHHDRKLVKTRYRVTGCQRVFNDWKQSTSQRRASIVCKRIRECLRQTSRWKNGFTCP